MKYYLKWLLALCLVFCVGNTYAQHRYYCEVKGIEKELNSGLKIIFDFGTKASYNIWGGLSSKLKFVDEKGEIIDFNSMVDAANYMVERGWIFYKDAESMEKAREGIITKSEYPRNKK